MKRDYFLHRITQKAVPPALALFTVLFLCACAGPSDSSYADSGYTSGTRTASVGKMANYAEEKTVDYAAEEADEGVDRNITGDIDRKDIDNAPEELAKAEEAAENKEKLVYTCWTTIQTLEFEKTRDAVMENVKKTGAIVESESLSDTDYSWYQNEYTKQNGTKRSILAIRVPSGKYAEFLDKLEGTGGKIIEQSQNVENITRRYNDQEIRIRALEKQESRLMEMMEQAETIQDMIAIEERLTAVQTDLNQAKSDIEVMDTDVKYSTVNLTIEEVVRYTISARTSVPFGERVKTAFSDSWKIFTELVQNLLIYFIYVLPEILLIGCLIFVIAVISRVYRKKHPRREPPVNRRMMKRMPSGRNVQQKTAVEQDAGPQDVPDGNVGRRGAPGQNPGPQNEENPPDRTN